MSQNPATDSKTLPEWETDPRLRRRITIRAFVLKLVACTLLRSMRLSVQPFDMGLELRDHHGAVCALWHGQQVPIFYAFRNLGVYALVSKSADGETIARLVEYLGYRTVRGSSSRAALTAIRELTRQIRPGQAVAVTPDGPRGPRHAIKPGIMQMAKQTGAPIIPIVSAIKHAWVFQRSWDRFSLPKPFTPALVVMGPPTWVPADADDTMVMELRGRLQRQMIELEQATGQHVRTARQRREWLETCDRRFREAVADHAST